MAVVTTGPVDALLEEALAFLPRALEGDETAARRFARAWRRLVRAIVPEDAAPTAAAVLDHLALTAPFDPRGPGGALVSAAAGIIGRMSAETRPAPLPEPLVYQRFSRTVLAEISGGGLERLIAGWQLGISDLARLFGVSRQAVQQWLDDGVPPSRQPKLLDVLRIADLLERNLLPERIPAVVRSPASALDDLTMFELIALDRHQELLDEVARSFDWAATG
jgi:transcriptional regulator with XRE-family HTH domain